MPPTFHKIMDYNLKIARNGKSMSKIIIEKESLRPPSLKNEIL